MGIFLGRPFWVMYDVNFIYALIDFFGFADFFSTPTMNATWWFMSAIIIFYLVFPFLIKLLECSPELLVLISIALMVLPKISDIPFIGKYFVWLPPFALGMVFADQNIFCKIYNRNNTIYKRILLPLIAIVVFAWIRDSSNNRLYFDSLFALSIILFSFLIVSRIPIINKVLEKLGQQSADIFMFHTFIFSYYFKDFIYWFKYAPIIFVVLTIICYITAIAIDYLKKYIRYDRLLGVLIK